MLWLQKVLFIWTVKGTLWELSGTFWEFLGTLLEILEPFEKSLGRNLLSIAVIGRGLRQV